MLHVRTKPALAFGLTSSKDGELGPSWGEKFCERTPRRAPKGELYALNIFDNKLTSTTVFHQAATGAKRLN
jgi:hypothetical protein